ncbi:MAG: DNA repair protein RadC [Lachnospiraceae bacterium]|nr:DNA repair protein RadC [Lachnospiraceae bacterium]
MKDCNQKFLTFISNKPYDKAKMVGLENLSDKELLAIIIRKGTNGVNALDIAEKILGYNAKDLSNLRKMSINDLQKFHGIGEIKALQIKACCELGHRFIQETRASCIKLTNSYSIAMFFMEMLRYSEREKVICAYFNTKLGMIGYDIISTGTKDEVIFEPSSIFKNAISKNASYIVLIHNHPSGDPTPSVNDYTITKRIFECSKLLGIPLKDHIIIGDNVYYSFFERNVLKA